MKNDNVLHFANNGYGTIVKGIATDSGSEYYDIKIECDNGYNYEMCRNDYEWLLTRNVDIHHRSLLDIRDMHSVSYVTERE